MKAKVFSLTMKIKLLVRTKVHYLVRVLIASTFCQYQVSRKNSIIKSFISNCNSLFTSVSFSLVERGFLFFSKPWQNSAVTFITSFQYILYEDTEAEIPNLPFRHSLFPTKVAFLFVVLF